MKIQTFQNDTRSLNTLFVFHDFLRNDKKIKTVLSEIKKNTKKDMMHHRTNVKATMSEYNSLLIKELDFFWYKVTDLLNILVKTVTRDPKSFNYFIDDAWAMKHEAQDFTVPHVHYPYQWSGAYYVEVPNSDTCINFSEVNANIKLENNLLLLFPSTFSHYVNPSKEKGSRYSLAFNITTNSNEN